MPFGLCNALAMFQQAIELVLQGLTWTEVIAYLDDVIVLGSSFDHHVANLREVFNQFQAHRLKLKPRKCCLFQKEVQFLGKIISEWGVSVNPQSVQTVLDWPTPHSKKELESFLGLVNYHRGHILGYAGIAASLYSLTGSKQTDFVWGSDQK